MRDGSLTAAVVIGVVLQVATPAAAVNAQEAPTVILAPGETVPEFDAAAIDGASKHIAYGKGGPTVLLFLSSG